MGTASVFAGGLELPSLCAVAGANDEVEELRILDSLVRKSLIVAHHSAERTRYSLFETIQRSPMSDRMGRAKTEAIGTPHFW
jgi:hypothetical protein